MSTISKHITPIAITGILLLLVCLSYPNQKDKAVLSEEFKAYPLDVANKLANYKSEANTKFLADFATFWQSTALNDDQRKAIMATTAQFEGRNLTADPFLTCYLRSMMVFFDSTTAVVKGFEAWNKGVNALLERKKFPKDIVLSVFESPLSISKEKAFFTSNYIKWGLSDKEITFKFDTTLYVGVSNSRLWYIAEHDTVSIFGTSGVVLPFTNQYVGKGGKVFWKKAGYDTTKVFADLKSYRLSFTRSIQNFDSVNFYFTDVFKTPLLGNLKLSPNSVSTKELVYYPHFFSYNRNISLTNLFDSINYKGGIAIKGHTLLGYGSKQEPAKVTFIRGKKPFITAQSPSFIIRSDGFSSNGASVVIRLLADSIVHNSKLLDFDSQGRELRLTSENQNMLTRAPYLDSYHKIGIYSEQLYWNMKKDIINFNAPFGSSESEAIFESINFFNQDMFDGLMRRDDKHPISLIRQYEKEQQKKKAFPLTCDGLSRFAKRSNADCDILLKEMGFLGYVIYDSESRVFTTTPKLREALRARNGAQDYDAILFNSENKKNQNNAILDLSNFNLTIYGIPQINLSDTQNVKVYPKNNSIILKKNRDMEFDGEIRAGLVTFKGDGFKFDYDNFNINMDKVVSMNFDYRTQKYDNTGKRTLNSITSTMEDITGVLKIDEPNNKSGLKRRPNYPKFASKKDSYIYYDDPSIFGGIYKRDKFYFKVFPYEIDSLNTFEKENLGFRGEFNSADIFIPFQETLVVQPDQSLGFSRKVDTTGATLYKSKGKFYNTIKLSNEGLIGKGSIRYLSSLSNSNAFLFFPDSCVSILKSMTIERTLLGIEYPNGNAKQHLMKWRPYQNTMKFFKDDTPFNLYDNQVTFNGDLVIEPLGLRGNGVLDVSTATISSRNFDMAAYTFKGDTSNVAIYDDKRESKLFAADQITSHIDLKNYQGKFEKKNDIFRASYPDLAYLAYAKRIGWDMNNQRMTIGTGDSLRLPASLTDRYALAYEGKTPPGSAFVSTVKEQDSLCFASPLATYDMRSRTLSANKVKHLLVADAALILNPKRDTVTVRSKGVMDRLYQADLYANRQTKSHHFYDVGISVGGRNGFNGQGLYSYIDKYGKVDTISFNTITVDREYKTTAFATIMDEDRFFLSPYFRFKGKVTAFSEKRHLTFDGGARLTHKYETLPKNWMRFTAEIAPDSVMIPLAPPYQTVDKIRVFAGTYIRRDSLSLYPTFFTGRKYTEDSAFVQPQGYLFYNDNGGFYQLSSIDKIRKPNTAGDMVSLYSEFDLLVNEGKLKLGADLGEVKVTTAGKAIQSIGTKEVSFTGAATLDFLFNTEALGVLTADVTTGAKTTLDYSHPNVKLGLRELLGDKLAETVTSSYAKTPTPEKLPEEFLHTLTLADVLLKWNKKTRSYISKGDIGIANIGGKQVNKRVKGFLELMPYQDHRMYLLLEAGNGQTYIFVYTSAGNMFASSTNEAFNTPIAKTKAKKRSIKQNMWLTLYSYTNADDRMVDIVNARYKQVKAMAE
ncbi:hypothetical protein [uncultured Acetobacteroides sp.]|uniref:hypothetical protein n=1 Tax=uncultured Acetobacteroides sp. TaxID=1760811 RepID=UPI0029F52B4A|nr:hypothetical protein [uncultured Acetobacteroides sp.]